MYKAFKQYIFMKTKEPKYKSKAKCYLDLKCYEVFYFVFFF